MNNGNNNNNKNKKDLSNNKLEPIWFKNPIYNKKHPLLLCNGEKKLINIIYLKITTINII